MTTLRDPARQRLRENLEQVREAISRAAARVGRDPSAVALLAVTKYAPSGAVAALYDLGVRDFGESTLQGAERKRQELPGLEGACWHLIGHLQRNKAAKALHTFATIHSVDSTRLAVELALQSQRRALPVPSFYIEVNVAGETQKTGAQPAEVRDLLETIAKEPPLAARLAGLMGMAPHGRAPEEARPSFRALRELRDALVREGKLAKESGLSMGMSGDFEVAIEEGATVVRVGTLIFEGVE